MRGIKKSAYFQYDIWQAVNRIAKREGFTASQAINWLLRKAIEAEDRK